jgi:hypothetical protein
MNSEALSKASHIVFMLTCLALVSLASLMTWNTRAGAAPSLASASAIAKTGPLPPGAQLPPPEGVSYSAASLTVALVVQSQCPYCAASMPFYKRLGDLRKTLPFQLVVASAESTTTTTLYLKQRGLTADVVATLKPGQIDTSGTPTLVLIDKEGVVIDSWLGQLSDSQENEVTGRIRDALGQRG